jgi:hypothetical protein
MSTNVHDVHGVRHNSVRDSLAFWLEKMVADHWPRRVRETSETGVLVFHDTLDQAACVGVNFHNRRTLPVARRTLAENFRLAQKIGGAISPISRSWLPR